jgi:hypothetical protein
MSAGSLLNRVDHKKRALAKAVRDDEHLGPKMRALNPQQRQFVIEILFGPKGGGAATRAVLAAGYADGNGDVAKVTAHRLINDPKIGDALEEIGRRYLKPTALQGLRNIVDIANDEQISPEIRLKANTYLAGLGGYVPQTHHTVHVEQSRKETVIIATEAVLARIAELAAQVGIDPQRQIEAAKMINGTAVEVQP